MLGQHAEGLYRELLDRLALGIAVWDLEDPAHDDSLRLIYANAETEPIAGHDLRKNVGQRVRDVLPSATRDQISFYANACREQRATTTSLIRYGDFRVVEGTYLIRIIPLGARTIATVFERIDALRRAESEARRLTSFLDSIVDQVPAMIFMKDAKNLAFERLNRAGEELLGLRHEDLLGKTDFDFFPEEQAAFFVAKDREVLANKTLEDIPEEPISTPRGTRWLHTRKIPLLDEHGEPRHLLGISVDITERKDMEQLLLASHNDLERRVAERTAELARQIEERERAESALARTEEQLRQSQKLEAIGRLAGGVAHDFNNLLSVVLGYSELLVAQLSEQDPVRGKIEEIRKASLRAAELTSQLLAFSRQQIRKPRSFNLSDVVKNMQSMLARLLGEDIELNIRAPEEIGTIEADPGQLEQVVMNLAVNARDAMPTGGKLLIEVSRVDLTDKFVDAHLGTEPGPHVLLAVSDTGVGMDKETLARIYDPFFTTKEQGTGLGLSTVFGIIKQSGGSIWAYSEPGHGSVFKVYLPVRAGSAAAEPVRSERVEDLAGNATVLLVEDDQQVRYLTSEILRYYGYKVLEASGGAEALEVARRYDGAIHLLLTDVVMPEMSGRALADKLLTARPALRVLFMSGYTDDAVVRHGILSPGVAFLQKPLTPETLALGVHAALHPRTKPLFPFEEQP